MRGFQPAEARAKAKNYADGGVVHSIKGMLGLRPRTPDELRAADAKAQERNQAAAAKVAARQAEAPAPAAAPQAAISQYSGMTALQRREKEAGFADGGLVRGPGTGTSDDVPDEVAQGTYIMPADSTDAVGVETLESMGSPRGFKPGGEKSVPVNLSNGEFKMPPEQVHAVGVQALDQMRNATHKPVRGFARQAQPEEPRQFFANGGVVTDEETQRLANQTSMYVQGAKASAASRPAAPATARPSPPPAVPKAAGFMPGVRAVFNESGKTIGDLASQGRYGAAAGETARAALATGPAMVDDVVGGALRAVAPAVVDAGTQFLGMGDTGAPASQGQAAATATGTGAPPAVTASAAPRPPDRALAATQAAPVVAPPATGTQPGMPEANQVLPSVYQHGRGQYSDSAAGMGLTAGGTGQPSESAVAAADNLVRGFQPGMGVPVAAPSSARGFQPGAVVAPTVRNSSNDWAARKALENAGTSASSITNNGGRFDRSGPGDSVAMAGFKTMLGTDQALQRAQTDLEQTALRESGGLQREGLQQAGATERTGMQEQGAATREAGRNTVALGELELRRTAAGFQTRAAAQLENLQTQYSAEKDPTRRGELARQIREFQGKEQAPRFKVAAGGQQMDASGVPFKVPDRIFNEQTGEVMQQSGLSGADMPPGMAKQIGTSGGKPVYQDANGKRFVAG